MKLKLFHRPELILKNNVALAFVYLKFGIQFVSAAECIIISLFYCVCYDCIVDNERFCHQRHSEWHFYCGIRDGNHITEAFCQKPQSTFVFHIFINK